jgi:hypothetical protein
LHVSERDNEEEEEELKEQNIVQQNRENCFLEDSLTQSPKNMDKMPATAFASPTATLQINLASSA